MEIGQNTNAHLNCNRMIHIPPDVNVEYEFKTTYEYTLGAERSGISKNEASHFTDAQSDAQKTHCCGKNECNMRGNACENFTYIPLAHNLCVIPAWFAVARRGSQLCLWTADLAVQGSVIQVLLATADRAFIAASAEVHERHE